MYLQYPWVKQEALKRKNCLSRERKYSWDDVSFQSGLTDASRNSKITIQEAEQQILNFLKMHIPPGKMLLNPSKYILQLLF
jgi:oligoribonuclease (3'-5' exoribonuclease)